MGGVQKNRDFRLDRLVRLARFDRLTRTCGPDGYNGPNELNGPRAYPKTHSVILNGAERSEESTFYDGWK